MIFRGAALLLALLAAPVMAECVVTMRLDSDPPYLMRKSDGSASGVNGDIAREALRRIGCSVEFREEPLGRALKELQEGKLGVISDMFRTPEREAYALFSHTRNEVANRLYVRTGDKNRWTLASFADLPRQGIRLGYESSSLASPDFQKVIDDPAFRTILFPIRTHEGLWRMLAAGRLDAVIMDELTARWELAQFGLDQEIAATGFRASTDPAFFAFSRVSTEPAEVRRFDEAIAAMRRDGTLAAILTSYGLDPNAAVDVSE